MVELNLDKINAVSPYRVAKEGEAKYSFATDSGLYYVLFFDKDELLDSDNVYQFAIINKSQNKSYRDDKLRDTIIAVLTNFFTERKNVMLYICEIGDGKQAARNRLFQWWNEEGLKAMYTYVIRTIKDEEGNLNYAALYSRTDNPEWPELSVKFNNLANFLSSKP